MLYHDDSQHIATTSAIKFSFLDILFIASKFFLDFSPGVRVICYRYLRYLFLFLFLFFFYFSFHGATPQLARGWQEHLIQYFPLLYFTTGLFSLANILSVPFVCTHPSQKLFT